MRKILEAFNTAYNAAIYSFAFCLRNNRKDTIIEMVLLAAQTILGYSTIMVLGNLVTGLQGHIADRSTVTFTLSDFVRGGYYIPITIFVCILFAEIILQKIRSYISSRRRNILRAANTMEIIGKRAGLDIARIRSKAMDDLTKKIEELPEGWYTRVSFSNEVMNLFGGVITFVIFGVSLLFSHPSYVAIIALSSLPMALAEFTVVNKNWLLSQELIPHQKKKSVLLRAYYGTTAFLQGVMFNQMGALSVQVRESLDYVVKRNDQLRWSNVKITLLAYMVAMAGLSIVLIHSVWSTLSIGGDIGALTIIIASSRRLQSSTRDIFLQVANEWLAAKGMIIIEREFFGLQPMIQTKDPIVPVFVGPPEIVFENVSFAYPDTDKAVLREVSFSIQPGSVTTIIGRNGSGKSSLMGLLLRHYDPTSGKITVGGISLDRITPTTWSEHACALLQSFVVHERTIGDEIASSRLDKPKDEEALRAAVDFAVLGDIIADDPKGLGAQIGTEFGGREFSGGQEQRLALARAAYRNSPILILDEPDAKLDPEAAEKLMKNIYALRGSRTIILITQHMSRATKSDKVIVLDNGQVVEQGSHDELMAQKGSYASMFVLDKSRLGG